MAHMPNADQMTAAVLQALRDLGGSGTYLEIVAGVIAVLGLSEEQQAQLHTARDILCSEFEYRLDAALNELVLCLVVEESANGPWCFPELKDAFVNVEPGAVRQLLSELGVRPGDKRTESTRWRHEAMTCVREQPATYYHRLMLRVLREYGLHHLSVTERTDSSITGRGFLQVEELVTLPVAFRCLRGSGLVGAGEVRALREQAQGGHALLVTTSTFSREALRAAYEDGLPAVDLVNGRALADMLEDLQLGIMSDVSTVQHVDVDDEYFGV